MNYEEVLKLALRRGFYLPSSETYSSAPAGFWEYGPLGTTLRNRYIELWRRELVRRDEMIEIDGAQIMPKDVFVASGHLESFSDPIVTCKACKTTVRADRLIADKLGEIVPERLPDVELDRLILQNNVRCPSCGGELDHVRRFNMMFKLSIGASEEEAYLRPETCQSIFLDFPRLYKVMRCKLPVAFAQFGKSFRNEVSPRQSLIRLREFFQAEVEVFFNPKRVNEFEKFEEVKDYPLRIQTEEEIKEFECEQAIEKKLIPNRLIAYYLALLQQFYEKTGIDMQRSRFRKLGEDEKAFYAEVAYDFEVKTSIGWVELVACNHRSDFDLKRHSKVSGQDFTVQDDDEKVLPHIFELSMGVDRSIYCIMEHTFVREKERDVLKLKPYLAPLQLAIFPLVTKDGLPEVARKLHSSLKKDFDTFYDESGSIGRRYRRMDEVGTPICVTVDYQTLEDQTVTLRDRDTMKQVRVKMEEVSEHARQMLRGMQIF